MCSMAIEARLLFWVLSQLGLDRHANIATSEQINSLMHFLFITLIAVLATPVFFYVKGSTFKIGT